MNYDMEAHIPQQIEMLLQHRSHADVISFDYILEGVKTIMKDEAEFIKGIVGDEQKRKKQHEEIMEHAKETIIKAFEGKTAEEGLNVTNTVISQVEQAFNAIELEYMNNVITTCRTFGDNGNESE